ncbi:MAG: TolC family outer membrane protein [Magnetococcales bacterium]|nr:TolC family outer membrane protein [Magnetococcales bacterium]
METFKRFLEATLENNPQIREAREKLKATEALLPQAKSLLLPDLSFQWSHNLTTYSWRGGGSHPDPTEAKVTLSQPLFNLESYRDYRRLPPMIAAATMDLETTKQKVFLHFVQLATNLAQGRDVLRLTEHNHTLTQTHLDATRMRHDAGELTRTDVSQGLARVYAAKADWITAQTNDQVNQAQWMELTGQEAPDHLEIPLIKPAAMTQAFPGLLAAIEERPDVAAEQLRQRAEEGNVHAREAGYAPAATLNTSGSRTWDPNVSGVSGTLDTTSVTVTVNWPLYSGGSTSAKIDEATARRESQRSILDQVRLAAIRELKTSLLECEKNVAVDQANAIRRIAARDALFGTTAEYQVGSRTSLDVLDAQHEYFSAQTEKIKSSYGLNLSRYAFLKALGQLSLQQVESSMIQNHDDSADAPGGSDYSPKRKNSRPTVP